MDYTWIDLLINIAYILMAIAIIMRLYLAIRYKEKFIDVIIAVILGVLYVQSKPLAVIFITVLMIIVAPVLLYYLKQSPEKQLVLKKWFYASVGYFITILIGLAIAAWIWITR